MFNKNVVAMVLSCGLVMVNGVGYSQAPGEWYITSKILPIPSDAIGSDAYGLNDKGDVTGAIYLPDGNSKPVIWTYNDEINYLQLAEDIDPLSINTGKSISQDGTMVSGYLGGIYKLVIWKNTELQPGVFLGEFSKFFGDKLLVNFDQGKSFVISNGAKQDILFPDPRCPNKTGDIYAKDVNLNGLVVGQYSITDCIAPGTITQRGFSWKDGSVTLFDDRTDASSVNIREEIVGVSYFTDQQYVSLWDANNTVTYLPTFGGTRLYPAGINDSGQVAVCTYNDFTGGYHQFIWENGVITTDIEEPCSSGEKLNNKGIILSGMGIITYKNQRKPIPVPNGYKMYTVREINDEYNFIGAIQKDGQNFGVIWTVVDMYNITTAVNPINGGTVTCSPNPVPRGTNSICTASANSGYVFSDWSGDCSGTTCTLSNVTSAKSVTANFALKTYNIATPVDPAGAGTVSCTLNPVPHGGESTCTANAAAGYTFTSWIGNCSIAVGNICTLSNVTSDQTLTARFTLTGPALSINNVTKKEGNKGTTNFTFTVTLNSASTQKVTVQYKTADGTAKAGSDYTATSGTLTFKAGQTSKTVTVKVIGDKAPEPDEMFFVNLNNVSSGVTILDGEGVGTITNDDR